jgi:hypothetical protein
VPHLVLGEALQRGEDVLGVDVDGHRGVERVGGQLVFMHEGGAVCVFVFFCVCVGFGDGVGG